MSAGCMRARMYEPAHETTHEHEAGDEHQTSMRVDTKTPRALASDETAEHGV